MTITTVVEDVYTPEPCSSLLCAYSVETCTRGDICKNVHNCMINKSKKKKSIDRRTDKEIVIYLFQWNSKEQWFSKCGPETPGDPVDFEGVPRSKLISQHD